MALILDKVDWLRVSFFLFKPVSQLSPQPSESEEWLQKANKRKETMMHLMWDSEVSFSSGARAPPSHFSNELQQRKMFFDYNFVKKERSTYKYLSTFYPLWVGLATKQQAQEIVLSLSEVHSPRFQICLSIHPSIPKFELKGGVACSPYDTGCQWDKPYGWAPLHLIVVEVRDT